VATTLYNVYGTAMYIMVVVSRKNGLKTLTVEALYRRSMTGKPEHFLATTVPKLHPLLTATSLY